ncbi:MAG: thiol reductant ABC exporter subunit CydD [Solirubrobacterales bacterium]|nr:thiol reductant ABC exporter subunit CydD [Solirubrobacterales bacterium]MCB8969892.1 thiol reductant ABC exporter subunit CydD [Thermoleophilales bacterium]MCO5327451.1 thiol reductant ABC exporter subunit CydD [Solirubrobacterales bacterium]
MNELGRRLLRSAGPGRRLLAIDAVLGVVSVALLIVQATLLANVISRAFLDGESVADLSGELIALAALAVARGLIASMFETAGRWGAVAVMSGLRRQLATKLLRERPGGLAGEQRGELATASVQGVDALEAYFAGYLPQLVISCIGPLAILIWSAPRDLIATAVLAVTVPLIPIFMVLVGRAAKRRADERWRTLTVLSGHFLDVVTGLKTLRANARADAQIETIERSGERYRDETIRTLRVGFLSALVLELLAMIGVALVAAVIGVQLAAGDLGLAAGLTVLILAPEVYMPLRRLGAQYHASTDGLAAAERIFEILDAPAAVSVAESPRPCPDPARSTLIADDVAFSYPGSREPALSGFTLAIEPGETVALVGPSGAGKTTLTHLLMRLADPAMGRVACGGIDLADVDPREWRRRISWIPQRPTIFPASVADNVRFAAPDASEADVLEALRRADALAFAEELPEGIETTIGDGSRELSMGQRQRIALARAFLRPGALVILDEPAANLDEGSERAVAAATADLLEGRSALLVAHRPEFVRLADRRVELRAPRRPDPSPVSTSGQPVIA